MKRIWNFSLYKSSSFANVSILKCRISTEMWDRVRVIWDCLNHQQSCWNFYIWCDIIMTFKSCRSKTDQAIQSPVESSREWCTSSCLVFEEDEKTDEFSLKNSTNISTVRCQRCNEKFSHRSILWSYQKKNKECLQYLSRLNVRERVITRTKRRNPQSESFSCEGCDESYIKRYNLYRHQRESDECKQYVSSTDEKNRVSESFSHAAFRKRRQKAQELRMKEKKRERSSKKRR